MAKTTQKPKIKNPLQVTKFYVGTWVPRIALHLQEFYYFLETGKSHLSYDKKELKKFHQDLNPQNTHILEKTISIMRSKVGRDYEFVYGEDGVFYLEVEPKKRNYFKEVDAASKYFDQKIIPTFNFLFSKGAPIPKAFIDIKTLLPIVAVAKRGTEKQIKDYFRHYNDSIQNTIKSDKGDLYYGNRLFVFITKKIKPEAMGEVIRDFIFVKEFETQLHKLLNLHRLIWEQVNELRESRRLRVKELPSLRDKLVDIKREVSYFSYRLDQMDEFLRIRKVMTHRVAISPAIAAFFDDRFVTHSASQEYMASLWRMTSGYINTTLDTVSLMYQENEQKQLSRLQVIFIIGVMASFLTLGAAPGAVSEFLDPNGQLVFTSYTRSFSIETLAVYGPIALLMSIAFYLIFNFFYTRVQLRRVINLSRYRRKSVKTIQEELR